jgi:small subunit ribosomal protein S1
MVVSLPYGVEGFAPNRHLKKEDGSQARMDESIDFKVIEFSKENKKIILSHSRIHEDQAILARQSEADTKSGEAKSTKRVVKIINENLERPTLGDLDVLADLKENLEKEEKANKKK